MKSALVHTGTDTSLPACASCACALGVEAGVLPFFCNDGEGGRHEPFCPQCFVYVRSLREVGRFMPGYFIPIKCGGCGLMSVSMGDGACGQCRSRSVVVLPPVAGVT